MQHIPSPKDADSTTFSFWQPVAKSKAAVRENEPPPRILQGLSSRGDKDQVGDWMDQDAIYFQPLLRSGIINWNHQPGPLNIIGEPLEASLRESKNGFGLFLRGMIWPEGKHAGADASWQLVEAMEKARSAGYGHRQLGWSVEGGILRRDPADHSHITRSVVRHMALTHEPVHAATYAEIAKSFGQTWVGEELAFHPDRNEHLAFESFEAFAKAMTGFRPMGETGESHDALRRAMGTGPGVSVSGLGAGSFAPLSGRAFEEVERFLGKGCRGRCRMESRGRNVAFTHLHECLGNDEDEAYDFVKSLVEALD